MAPRFEDETLLRRIQNYVSRDINSRIPLGGEDKQYEVKPLDIYIISFERVLNTWSISCSAETDAHSFYKIVYDGDTGVAIVHIYIKHSTHNAVI